MIVLLPIPDDLVAELGGESAISRRALEAFAADEYRAGRLSRPKLRLLLGFDPHAELDGFFKARGILKKDARTESNQQRWDRTHPSDEEIQKMVDADPDVAPILTKEERASKSFVRMPKREPGGGGARK